jgi:hypothetical protein
MNPRTVLIGAAVEYSAKKFVLKYPRKKEVTKIAISVDMMVNVTE